MNLSEAAIIFVISEIIIFFSLIWKVASKYGELKEADKRNHDDTNNLGRKVRKYDRLTWQRIDSIEAFLQARHDYNPPSLNLFEDDKN